MPQMTPAEARVIDPVLTEIARGYKNAAFVGARLAPVVPVGQRGGRIIEFGKESFRLYETATAPGAKIAELQLGYGSRAYALVEHKLMALVPTELMEEAQAVPGIDLASAAVRLVQDAISLRVEKDLADAVRDAAIYDAAHKVTLSGTSQWSDPTSDPLKDVETWKEVVRASIGQRPNVLVMGGAVFAALKTHPKITDRIKYTSRDVATPELLGQLFGLEVLVGDGVYEQGGAFADIWGKDVILAYTQTASVAQQGAPSFAYTYRLRNYPVVIQGWLDRDRDAWKYPVHDAVAPVVVGPDAGFLAQNVVA